MNNCLDYNIPWDPTQDQQCLRAMQFGLRQDTKHPERAA